MMKRPPQLGFRVFQVSGYVWAVCASRNVSAGCADSEECKDSKTEGQVDDSDRRQRESVGGLRELGGGAQ